MARAPLPARIFVALLAVLLIAASASLAWAVADDYRTRDVVPLGVAVGGERLDGLDKELAVETIRAEVVRPLLDPVTVRHRAGTSTLDPKTLVSVDVDGMVADALQPNRDRPLHIRVYDRAAGRAVEHAVPVMLSVDETAVAAWVASLAETADTRPRDASITVEGTKVTVTTSVVGFAVDRAKTASVVADALQRGGKTVDVPMVALKPKVTEKDLGKTIVVSRSKRRLYLYDGAKLEKTYSVAVGTARYPTPRGWWKIVNKRFMPTWRNPGSAWAKDMPASIPPGPSNPLGTRALDLNASGIRIHGSSNNASIGTAASHGCMRMHMWDIEDLYPRVPVGTRVVIVS